MTLAPHDVLAPGALATRLSAAAPGWIARADIVVVGSGIAGLTTALKARRAGRVLLVTKTVLDAGSTRWAQGGIAAALGPEDTPEEHLTDTLVAGAGPTRFTGPLSGSSRSRRMAATWSVSVIHGSHWWPSPALPPRPSLKMVSCFASAPPRRSSTTPVRR